MTEKLPAISRDLIAYLERTFPDKLPDLRDTEDRDIHALCGEQRVVRKLKDIYTKQNPLTS